MTRLGKEGVTGWGVRGFWAPGCVGKAVGGRVEGETARPPRWEEGSL